MMIGTVARDDQDGITGATVTATAVLVRMRVVQVEPENTQDRVVIDPAIILDGMNVTPETDRRHEIAATDIGATSDQEVTHLGVMIATRCDGP